LAAELQDVCDGCVEIERERTRRHWAEIRLEHARARIEMLQALVRSLPDPQPLIEPEPTEDPFR
jgi:hypothetical protein